MKQALILAAGLLVPMGTQAGVSVQVNVGVEDHYGCGGAETDADCEDVWFEDCHSNGPLEVSLEYQWYLIDGHWRLRFRRVAYHTVRCSWDFGPWQVQVGYCHPGCRINHVHTHYERRHQGPRVWHVYRTPAHGNRYGQGTYRYEYRYDGPRAKKRVYHYETRNEHVRQSRGNTHHQARTPSSPPAPRQAPPAVSRPPIRPVPSGSRSNVVPQPAQSKAGLGKGNTQQSGSGQIGGTGYNPSPSVRSGSGSITRVSGRERVR